MKNNLVVLVFLLLSSCGNEAVEPELHPQEEPECLNCDMELEPEEIELPEPTPHVYLYPSELMFYYDAEYSDYPFTPRSAHVVNSTQSIVFVTNAFIVGDDSLFGEGGSQYFSLSELDLPFELGPEDTMPMEVSFLYSTRQRMAWLVVITTYPSNEVLFMRLSGKVFLF